MRRLLRSMKRAYLAIDGGSDENERTKTQKISSSGLAGPDADASGKGKKRRRVSSRSNEKPKKVSKPNMQRNGSKLSREQALETEESTRWYFSDQEKARYASGPGRMIATGADGRRYPAILLSKELSEKFQNAAYADREMRLEMQKAHHQLGLIEDFRKSFPEAIDRVTRLRNAHRDVEGKEDVFWSLNEQHNDLTHRKGRADRDENAISQRLAELELHVRAKESIAAAALEEVLIDCQLMERQPEVDLEATEWDVEFERRFGSAKNNAGKELELSYHGSDTAQSEDHKPVARAGDEGHDTLGSILQVDPKIEARIDASRAFCQADLNLRLHRRKFEDRQSRPLRQRDDRAQFAESSSSQLETPHYLRVQELTRNLIVAEEEYATAKRQALDAGVQSVFSNQSSGFPEQSNDGQGSGELRQPRKYVDEARVLKWLQSIPDADAEGEGTKVPAEQPHDMAEWDFRPVDIRDSASAVAEGNERKRIDRWRRACEALRSE